MKRIVLGISAGISLVLFLILFLVSGRLGRGQISQTEAERWSDQKNVSQVSCFFTTNARITLDTLEDLEHSIDSDLADNGIMPDPEKPGARLWIDAYSASGEITLTTDRATVSAEAIGVGGEFFRFHPLPLLYGYYFPADDVMTDYCVIDQDAAWQLFGSSNVVGMTVYISGIPHMITGVVKRGDSRLEKAAGLDKTLVYVSYETLNGLGYSRGLNHYEIVMPNPVSGFAANYIKDKLGYSEKESEVVENTARYSFLSGVKRIAKFGTRSMQNKAIIYPYWENVARGYEDYLTAAILLELIFLGYAVLVISGLLIYWWRHKNWTVSDVWHIVVDKLERLGEKLRAKRLEVMSQLRKSK